VVRMLSIKLSKSCGLFCNLFGLRYELFSGGFSGALGFGRRSVLRRAETFDRSFWKISFTCVRRFFTTFGSPFLVAPVFQGLLWLLNHDSRHQLFYIVVPPFVLFWLTTLLRLYLP